GAAACVERAAYGGKRHGLERRLPTIGAGTSGPGNNPDLVDRGHRGIAPAQPRHASLAVRANTPIGGTDVEVPAPGNVDGHGGGRAIDPSWCWRPPSRGPRPAAGARCGGTGPRRRAGTSRRSLQRHSGGRNQSSVADRTTKWAAPVTPRRHVRYAPVQCSICIATPT